MPWRKHPNRSSEYRTRAAEARAQAAATLDEATRHRLLQDADTWERMASYEENRQSEE